MKKYKAKSSRDALRMVRLELGADAVILSNSKVEDGVEIVAIAHNELALMTQPPEKPAPAPENVKPAAQSQPPVTQDHEPNAQNLAPITQQQPAQPEQQKVLSEIKLMRDMMQEQIACLSWSDMQHRDPQRARLLRNMLNAGFSPALSRLLLDKMPANANIAWVQKVLEHNLRVATQEEDVVTCGGAVALIGPTGVGKTTTVAKLAARAVVRFGASRVALLTTDSYRIGAYDQLRIYGKILGVPVHAVRDTADLRLTLSALKHKHLVLIDTIGMGQRDSRVPEQASMFDENGVQRLLLLNAASSGDTLDDVVRKYHSADVIGCIPTKLDEAATLGAVLDAAIRHKLTLHYVANGQRVPEDLHEVNLEYLLHRALRLSSRVEPFALQELELPALMAGSGMAREIQHAS